MKTINNTLGSSGLSSKEREALDFYQTPVYAIRTLIERFDFKSNVIWEPMAGNGMIAKPLREAGYDVKCSDIVERKFKLDCAADYFSCSKPFSSDDFSIVTNPPYSLTNDFLKHTLETVKPRTCSLFLPIRYLEGKLRYDSIYSRYKPSKVFVYAQRLGCFKESDVAASIVNDKGTSSAVAYMWLCFDCDTWDKSSAKTEIEWIP